MKLKDLKPILYSTTGGIQWAVVYDLEKNEDIERCCSVEFAIAHYGECEVKRINSYYNCENGNDYIVITI